MISIEKAKTENKGFKNQLTVTLKHLKPNMDIAIFCEARTVFHVTV